MARRKSQLDILKRVASGESTLYAPRNRNDLEDFDKLVEHVEALEQRGMLTHAPPKPGGRPGRGIYASIGALVITPREEHGSSHKSRDELSFIASLAVSAQVFCMPRRCRTEDL